MQECNWNLCKFIKKKVTNFSIFLFNFLENRNLYKKLYSTFYFIFFILFYVSKLSLRIPNQSSCISIIELNDIFIIDDQKSFITESCY